ncbi:hypothetical protein L1987_33893 [Smallanthus sonchifolius]|uniref:Uncharacterized protein n=1 Tax=Smallanthus sonchifolius TaxID=185202 RepID=A0ACB9HSB1_9ASTR|nr:hypothetical protein L1987_33893 [Smallanthus sonchifolius]
MSDEMEYMTPANKPVALKPNDEEKKLEWWVSSLHYLSKQQNVDARHTLQRRGIPVSELMSDNIPKDVKVYEKLEDILELEMKEDGKVDRILDIVQQLVSNENNVEEWIKKRKFVEDQHHMGYVEGEDEEEVNTEHMKNMRIFAIAYGTPGPSVESSVNIDIGSQDPLYEKKGKRIDEVIDVEDEGEDEFP